MLTVIEHHETVLVAERIDHALRHRATLARLDRERSRDHARKSLRIGQRPELNEPGAIAEPLKELRGDLHCETRLPHTTDTRECDDARLLERLDDVGHVVVAPDERGRLEREVRRERLDGAKRGKVARERGMHDLEDAFRLAEVPQPVLAQIHEPRTQCGMSRVSSLRRRGQHHLTAVRDPHDPRRTVDRRCRNSRRRGSSASHVWIPIAHPQRSRLGHSSATSCDLEARPPRPTASAAVANTACAPSPVVFTTCPPWPCDRGAQDRVVTRQRRLHRVGVLLPQPRRTLDVGEQEGDRPRRQLRHPGPLHRSHPTGK